MKKISAAFVLVFSLLIGGCGNTGPLQLPADAPKHNPHHPPVNPQYPVEE